MRYAFLVVGFLLFFAWIGAFIVFHVAGALIHLLLVVALLFIVFHLFRSRRAD